jgi:hypothetical protein
LTEQGWPASVSTLFRNDYSRNAHGARHAQRQQGSGRAQDHARDHDRGVLQHKPLEPGCKADEGVVERDDRGPLKRHGFLVRPSSFAQATSQPASDAPPIRLTSIKI